MHLCDVNGRRYAQFERLREQRGLIHAFSTRPENVSPRPGPLEAERAARRAQVAADFGLDAGRLHYCVQKHETRIAVVAAPQTGGALDGYDGIVLSAPGVPVMTFSADCPLVLIYDARQSVVGVVHASWRCTVAGLARQLVALMCSRFGCDPSGLLAGIGPAAGPCCYEVGDEVLHAAQELPNYQELFDRRGGRLYFDLWRANVALLCDAGLRPENIETADVCTMCRNDLFYSYRREGTGCGHFGLMAALAE